MKGKTIMELKEEMYNLIEKSKSSGQNHRLFCKDHQISEAKFYYWQKRYEQTQLYTTKENFIPLEITTETKREPIEITYPNGVKIKLTGNTSLSQLRMFIELL